MDENVAIIHSDQNLGSFILDAVVQIVFEMVLREARNRGVGKDL